jgi:Raf kinase inhibitor-like YbhB/YbcL family protein
MRLRSTSFEENGRIPKKYTKDGDNISPAIIWDGVPDGAAELALLVEDPDAPTPDPFVHWLVYGIDTERDGIPEDSSGGAVEGLTSGGEVGYTGPAPPADGGPHRYRFRLLALDESPGLKPGATREALMEIIDGHVLEEAELVGTYGRQIGETEE